MTALSPGADLYRIVCDYAALGHHRSDTDRDPARDAIIRRLEIDGDRPYLDPDVP